MFSESTPLIVKNAQIESTALIWAAMNGHAECVRLLLDADVDKEAKDNVRIGLCHL